MTWVNEIRREWVQWVSEYLAGAPGTLRPFKQSCSGTVLLAAHELKYHVQAAHMSTNWLKIKVIGGLDIPWLSSQKPKGKTIIENFCDSLIFNSLTWNYWSLVKTMLTDVALSWWRGTRELMWCTRHSLMTWHFLTDARWHALMTRHSWQFWCIEALLTDTRALFIDDEALRLKWCDDEALGGRTEWLSAFD